MDWRKPTDYPDAHASGPAFAWEFLRRSQKYRDAFKRASEAIFCTNDEETHWDYDYSHPLIVQIMDYFYVGQIIDPDLPWNKVGGFPFITGRERSSRNPDFQADEYHLVMRFDIRKPVAEHLKALRKEIESLRKCVGFKRREGEYKIVNGELLQQYLRVLDAHNDEVSFVEMARHFSSEGMKQSADTVRKQLPPAKAYQEYKYRSLTTKV